MRQTTHPYQSELFELALLAWFLSLEPAVA